MKGYFTADGGQVFTACRVTGVAAVSLVLHGNTMDLRAPAGEREVRATQKKKKKTFDLATATLESTLLRPRFNDAVHVILRGRDVRPWIRLVST